MNQHHHFPRRTCCQLKNDVRANPERIRIRHRGFCGTQRILAAARYQRLTHARPESAHVQGWALEYNPALMPIKVSRHWSRQVREMGLEWLTSPSATRRIGVDCPS